MIPYSHRKFRMIMCGVYVLWWYYLEQGNHLHASCVVLVSSCGLALPPFRPPVSYKTWDVSPISVSCHHYLSHTHTLFSWLMFFIHHVFIQHINKVKTTTEKVYLLKKLCKFYVSFWYFNFNINFELVFILIEKR